MFFKKKERPVDNFQGVVRLSCLEVQDNRQLKWRILSNSVHLVETAQTVSYLQAIPFIGRMF